MLEQSWFAILEFFFFLQDELCDLLEEVIAGLSCPDDSHFSRLDEIALRLEETLIIPQASKFFFSFFFFLEICLFNLFYTRWCM